MPILWPSTRSSTLSTTPSLGKSPPAHPASRAHVLHRSWHEQDPDELVDSCEVCINEACKALEAAGWAKESVKVIGAYLHHFPVK